MRNVIFKEDEIQPKPIKKKQFWKVQIQILTSNHQTIENLVGDDVGKSGIKLKADPNSPDQQHDQDVEIEEPHVNSYTFDAIQEEETKKLRRNCKVKRGQILSTIRHLLTDCKIKTFYWGNLVKNLNAAQMLKTKVDNYEG